jgi:hypothetical protein
MLLVHCLLQRAATQQDKSVSVIGSCSVLDSEGESVKFKCGTPNAVFGISERAANHTGVFEVIPSLCKPVSSKNPNSIALVNSGKCAYSKMASVAAKSGWAAIVVIEGKKFKSKAAVEMKKKLAVPVFTVTQDMGKKLAKQAGAQMQATLKAMKLMPSGVYMDAVQLYSESKNAGRREELELAAEYARMSAELDPRVYVAHYTHANYLYDVGKEEESRAALGAVLDLPLSPTLYSDMETTRLECDSTKREQHKLAVEAAVAAGGGSGEPKLRVVTVATSDRPELELLRNSVKKSTGIELETLGLGHVYPGLGFKLVMMEEWLKDVPGRHASCVV